MPSPLVLFIAEGCRHSRELMNNYGECLSRISDRIFYYDLKDTNAKRKKITQSAIEYHHIKQFPSLVCENGTILQSGNSIATAIQELCQIAPQPAFTNLKVETVPGANKGIAHHSASVDTSSIGHWPSPDEPSAPDPRAQQQQQGYSQQQQQQGYYQPQQGGYPPQQQAQQGYPPQQQQGLYTGFDPHEYQQDGSQGGYHGIGGGGMIGAGETNMAQNGGTSDNVDTANIGHWPTTKKVHGLTGTNGVMGHGAGNGFGGSDPRDRANQIHQQKGQMNQQQTNMMMNNYGQPVAQPYQMY